MSTKKAVFLSDYTANWIQSTTTIESHAQGPKWSESINSTFDQLRYLLKTSLPELSIDEWEIILNVYAGSYFPAHGVPARIARDMMDNVGACSIEELSHDYAKLVKKVHTFSQTQQLAILYFVQIFWVNDWSGSFDEITKSIKEKF